MDQVRAWTGPALFSFSFRPFFLGAALCASLSMALWIATLQGVIDLPTAFDPVSWHAHEFLFGYLGASAAGFLMTAVPNWTGRMPIVGWPLVGLFCLWIIGRLAVALSAFLPAGLVAALDLAFPTFLVLAMGREIVVGRNWRNLKMLGILVLFAAGNVLFHLDAATGGFAAEGTGFRLGLAAALLLVAVIGGRIIPSFTRNWLVRQKPGRLPAPPEQPFDRAVLLILAATLALWVLAPFHTVTGLALLCTGILHLWRLARWAGERTGGEALVLILHLAYAWLPVGCLLVGLEILRPGSVGATAALHPWLAGAIALMTLAVMTRATLGHTGQPLTAGTGTTTLFAAVLLAVLARLAAGSFPEAASWLYLIAGLAWIAGYLIYLALYGPLLLRPRSGR